MRYRAGRVGTRPFADHVPNRVKTVKGLVRVLIKNEFFFEGSKVNESTRKERSNAWSRRSYPEVARKVFEVISEVFEMDVQQLERAGEDTPLGWF